MDSMAEAACRGSLRYRSNPSEANWPVKPGIELGVTPMLRTVQVETACRQEGLQVVVVTLRTLL